MPAGGDELFREIGKRAAVAAAAGEATFAVPELASVAATIAADPRAGPVRARAARWAAEGASYHELVRLSAAYVLELERQQPSSESVYVLKAGGELEPLLALWPDALALPTIEMITTQDMIKARAFPVHWLGVVPEASWADGRVCSPAEYFFHDLDHARYKVREDLKLLSVEISDPYREGTTFDALLGRHRTILTEATGRVGPALWDAASVKAELARQLLRSIDGLADPALAEAALLLLFEVIHEKSLPLHRDVLQRELSAPTHLLKLRRKADQGFFGPHPPGRGVIALLESARVRVLELLS